MIYINHPPQQTATKTLTNPVALLQQQLLVTSLIILFTSLSLLSHASEGEFAPIRTASSTSTPTAPSSFTEGGGGSGSAATDSPCEANEVQFNQIMNITKGISAFGTETYEGTANPQILVVVRNVSGQEQYSKIHITGRQGSAFTASDCMDRLEPGTYTVVATSRDEIIRKTIVIK
jgi:hypothetical protein